MSSAKEDAAKALSLGDMGERRLISDLIAPRFDLQVPWLTAIGEDCAVLELEGRRIAVTTDPCPLPVVALLGDDDLYHWGWLTVVINLSDLAAVGARPVGLVTSVVAPMELPIASFNRFLDGVEAAARKWKCPIVGGNMKEGPEFSATGTALGELEGEFLSRRGAQDGDLICVAGDIGLFWSAVLARQNEIAEIDEALLTEFAQALTHPTPKVEWGLHLARLRLATACIDASDGLGSAVASLAAASDVAAVLRAEALRPRHVKEIASRTGVNPTALGLAWGDWQLVFTVSPSKFALLNECRAPHQVTVIGHIESGHRGVFVSEEGCMPREIHIRGDQRFAEASYFTEGLHSYVDVLRSSPYANEAAR